MFTIRYEQFYPTFISRDKKAETMGAEHVGQIYYTGKTSRKLKQHTVVNCDCDCTMERNVQYMPCAGENQESFFCVITGNITLRYTIISTVVV
jgi:hypothetical protein